MSEMSIRHYFAAMAMQGMLSNPDLYKSLEECESKVQDACAGDSVMYADALLAALSQEEKPSINTEMLEALKQASLAYPYAEFPSVGKMINDAIAKAQGAK